MKNKAIVVASLVSLAVSCSAMAEEVAPLQASTFVMGSHTASVYYTEHDERFEVVTTIVPDAEPEGAPIRFVGSLELGETQTVSVGEYDPSSVPRTLELKHNGDHLLAIVSETEVAIR